MRAALDCGEAVYLLDAIGDNGVGYAEYCGAQGDTTCDGRDGRPDGVVKRRMHLNALL